MICLLQMRTADTANTAIFATVTRSFLRLGLGTRLGHDVCGVSARVVYDQALQMLFTYPTGNTPLKGSH